MSHSPTRATGLRLKTINQPARNRKGRGITVATRHLAFVKVIRSNFRATGTHKTFPRCCRQEKSRAHCSCVLPFLPLSRHYANDCPCTAVVACTRRSLQGVSYVGLASHDSVAAAGELAGGGSGSDRKSKTSGSFGTTGSSRLFNHRASGGKRISPQSALENTFRLRLVLGEKPERFTIDDPSGN